MHNLRMSLFCMLPGSQMQAVDLLTGKLEIDFSPKKGHILFFDADVHLLF